jgi:hypothetical protein
VSFFFLCEAFAAAAVAFNFYWPLPLQGFKGVCRQTLLRSFRPALPFVPHFTTGLHSSYAACHHTYLF